MAIWAKARFRKDDLSGVDITHCHGTTTTHTESANIVRCTPPKEASSGILGSTECVNGTQLKPGDYKVEIAGDKVIFKQGKTAVEVAAKVEDATEKYNSNVVRYSEGGKMQEMRIGGTHTRLVFEGGGSTSAPAGDR